MAKGEWSRNSVGVVLAMTMVGLGGIAVSGYQVHSAQVAGARQVAENQRVIDAARAARMAVEQAAQAVDQGAQQSWHREVESALLGLEYVGANQIEVREQAARVRGLWTEHQSATSLMAVLAVQKRTADAEKLAQTGYQAQVRHDMRAALEEIEVSGHASSVVRDVQTKAQTRDFLSSTVVLAAGAFASVGLVGFRLRREQRAHQETASRSRLRREMAVDAMVTVDAEGRIHDVNRRAEDLLGYHQSELVGESIEVVVPQRIQLPGAGEAGAPATSLEGVRQDGTAFPITLEVRPVLSEDFQRLTVCTIREAQAPSQGGVAEERSAAGLSRTSMAAGSVRDPLTDLFTRNYLEEFLEAELRRSGRKHRRVGTIIVDLDRFRQVNDAHGVAAGDAVLRGVSARLRARTRREDVVARYAGEEFAIVLPEASIEATKQCAEQVREELRDLRVQSQDKTIGPVTVSVGVAVYPDHGVTAEDLLSAAKQALTQAKSGGRDRVVVAQPLSWEPTGAELAMLSKRSGA